MSEKEDNQNFIGSNVPELPTVITTETAPTATTTLSLNLFGNGGIQLPYTFNFFGGGEGPQPPPPLNLFGGGEPRPPPPLNLFGGGEPQRPPPLDLTSCMHDNDPSEHDPRFLTPLDLSRCSFYSSCPIETAQNHLEDLLKAMSPRSKLEHEAQTKLDEMNARRLIEEGQLKAKAKSKMTKSLSWSDHIGEALEMIREISPRPNSSIFKTFVASCADTVSHVSGGGNATPRALSGGDGSPPILTGGGGGGGGGGDGSPRMSNSESMYTEYINLFEHLR
jgi:hypothetical protein